MKKKSAFRLFTLMALAFAAASCVRSLQPLYEDDDLVFEPRLAGSWTDGAGEDLWTFERAEGKEYRLTCRASEDQTEARFRGRLGKLGGAFFLDLYPDKRGASPVRNDLLALHLVPAHTFWRVRFEGGLHLDPFSADWLKEEIRGGRVKISHVETSDEIILTADTRALQVFLAGLAADDGAFPPSSSPLRKR